ncbi:N-acetylmuramic acid 6-phosphate etherase [bacterium]|nr:N-acetylmuramic acid 6-phosphate etherase [bacterium]
MDGLPTEQPNELSARLDTLTTAEILGVIHGEDRTVSDAVEAAIPALTEVVEAAVTSIRNGGRLVYVGAGTSGRLGVLDAAECPPTYGVPPTMVVGIIAGGEKALTIAQEGAEDDEQQAIRDLEAHSISEKDTVLGITARGKTPWVRSFLREANRLGAWTGLLTCNPVDKTEELATLVTLEVGPEVVTGSTRMKAGLATKMALTMISTATMVRLGRVKGNRMVHLMPNSTKLQARQVRMIMEERGISLETAYDLLKRADGDLERALRGD